MFRLCIKIAMRSDSVTSIELGNICNSESKIHFTSVASNGIDNQVSVVQVHGHERKSFSILVFLQNEHGKLYSQHYLRWVGVFLLKCDTCKMANSY